MNEKKITMIWVLLAFILLTAWAMSQPFNAGPDEEMRYLVADYIYSNHGALPRGDDPAIRNATWGISYAYYPILSYMISAAFMGVASIFGASGIALFRAARMADVLFVTCAVYFLVKASGKLFPREKFSREVRWMFTALAGFIPQAIFLGTYVNTDSLALMSAALILYVWASYLREDWTWKNCMILAVGMALCALSYYNAYGWILCSFFLFCLTVLLCREEPLTQRVRFLFGRGYPTPEKLNWNWLDIIFYQDPGWYHNWALTVCVSFIGTFGLMGIYMPYMVSKMYIALFAVGVAGIFLVRGTFSLKKSRFIVQKKNVADDIWKIKTKVITKKWNAEGIFHILMVLLIIIPVILFMYYVYYNDNQAQGRYLMPALYPLMYFVTLGWNRILTKVVKNEKVRSWIYRVVTVLLVISPYACWAFLIVPYYAG